MRFGIQVRNVFNLERLFKKNKSGRNLQREIVNPMEASPDQFEATLFHHLLPMGNGFCEGLLGYAQLIWSIKKSQEDGKRENGSPELNLPGAFSIRRKGEDCQMRKMDMRD